MKPSAIAVLLALGALLPASAAAAATPRHARHAAHPAAAPAAPAVPLEAMPKLSNFADLVFDGIVGENAPELTMDFVAGTMLGSLPLIPEKTRLADIVALDGGSIHTQGDGATRIAWLCYTRHAATAGDIPVTVWFTAGANATKPGDTVGMVVVENVDASRTSGCATAPAGFVPPTFSVPALGTSLPELSKKFGSAKRDRQGNVYYDSARPLDDGSGNTVYQTLGYRLTRGGKVAAIALGQTTTH